MQTTGTGAMQNTLNAVLCTQIALMNMGNRRTLVNRTYLTQKHAAEHASQLFPDQDIFITTSWFKFVLTALS